MFCISGFKKIFQFKQTLELSGLYRELAPAELTNAGTCRNCEI